MDRLDEIKSQNRDRTVKALYKNAKSVETHQIFGHDDYSHSPEILKLDTMVLLIYHATTNGPGKVDIIKLK